MYVLNHHMFLRKEKMFEGGPFENKRNHLIYQSKMVVCPAGISQFGDNTDGQMYIL